MKQKYAVEVVLEDDTTQKIAYGPIGGYWDDLIEVNKVLEKYKNKPNVKEAHVISAYS